MQKEAESGPGERAGHNKTNRKTDRCSAFEGFLAGAVHPAGSGGSPWVRLLASFLILTIVSFTMLWLGDKINAQGMAITRYLARVQAPLSGRFYPQAARDRITVLMYDESFLRDNGSAWPIGYGDHADWLLRLAGDAAARPKAILLDVTFGQERDDPSLPRLQEALCTIQNEYRVPVFLAAIASREDGRLHVRPELEATQSAGKPCFTLVGVGYEPDPVDRMVWSYPLTTHLAEERWEPGPPHHGRHAPSYRSAAMALAQDAAGIELGEEEEPMALVWGATTPSLKDAPPSLAYCQAASQGWGRLVPKVLRQLWEDEAQRPTCPYHATLSMAQVGTLSDQELAPYLSKRFLFVGAAVPGYNDLVDSPVHGLIPGVYMHAMALDNLLVYKDRYKQSGEWRLPPSGELFLAGLVAILAVFIVHLAWERVSGYLSGHPRVPGPVRHLAKGHGHGELSLCGRLGLVPLRLCGWLLRLALQTSAAMLLIALLQAWFRVGMLPVVELVGMTILAEGLEYTEKIHHFIAGKTPSHEPAGHEPAPDPAHPAKETFS